MSTAPSATLPRSQFARAIAISGILAMLIAAAYASLHRSGLWQWLTPAVAVAYVLWVLSEWRITTAPASEDPRTDRYTCEAYASARFLTMIAALAPMPLWSDTGLWLPLGLAIFAAGIALRAWAIVTLGRCYSHRVRTPEAMVNDGAGIVSHGPYRRLRHPAYSGMLLAHVGLALLFLNPWVVLALGLTLVPALVRRIRVEEAHLMNLAGYPEFAATRARLAPGVW